MDGQVITTFRIMSTLIVITMSQVLHAQDTGGLEVAMLKSLTIEELLDIQITSVSKIPEKLQEVASAIQVLTNEDIRRSGATNIPEALRLASNLQVAQLNSSSWIISARGFNTVFANKLLVLIDGRTVYTPLFAGVVWELQNVLLEDIDRIEIISGPGGTLWGANAVNGVINIITKKATDTHGSYATAVAGDFLKKAAAVRYGGQIGKNVHFRVYGQFQDRNGTNLADGNSVSDSWNTSQGGFRFGYYPNEKDFVVVQSDIVSGTRKTKPEESPFDGQNILARWTRELSEKSNFILQAYYDRYWWGDPVSMGDELQTYDLDFQHRLPLGKNHDVLWGIGYRLVKDNAINRTAFVGLVPEDRTMPLYSGFIQDEITITEDLNLTLGTKLLHNIFSGFEVQPSARLAWTANTNNTLWTAISRAIRAPSRLDVDYHLPIERQPPNLPSVAGGPDFDSEKVLAFELGYRLRPNSKSTFSVAAFYNDYNDLYSVEPLQGTLTYQIQNGSEAETWGAEFTGLYQVAPWWRVRGGYTYFATDLRPKEGKVHDPSYLMNDPKHLFVIQSMLDLPGDFKVDIVGRYVDYIPQSFATSRINEYFEFDTRIAWEYKRIALSLVGQNLYRKKHTEFGVSQIPRSIYGRISARF